MSFLANRALKRTLRALLVVLALPLGLGAVGGAMWLGDRVHIKTYVEHVPPDYDPTRPLPVAALREDFRIIRGAVETEHGAPYRYTPERALRAGFDAAYARLERPMSEVEFVKLVGPPLHAVHDGHTNLMLPRAFYEDEVFSRPIFPATLYFARKRVYVLKDGTAGGRLPRGSELLAVDGEPVGRLVRRVTNIFRATDGYTFGAARQMLGAERDVRYGFMTYLAYLKGFPASYRVTVKTPDGTTTLRLRGRRVHDILASTRARYPAGREAGAPTRLGWAGAVPVLTLESFGDESGTFGDYAAFLARSFADIRERGARGLVIDLRENGGGWGERAWFLLKYLQNGNPRMYRRFEARTFRSGYTRYADSPWGARVNNLLYRTVLLRRDRARGVWVGKDAALTASINGETPPRFRFPDVAGPPFTGRVVLLVSGQTFSAGSDFAALARRHLPGLTVVGQETGGGAAGLTGGRHLQLTLPNTRLTLRVPLVRQDYAGGDGLRLGRGVRPDIEVWPTFGDVLTGRDRVMEAALAHLRGRRGLN